MPHKMPDLLKIHALDKYWYADNLINHDYIANHKKRSLEIETSLKMYPITSFVVLDDMSGLDEYFPNNIVKTSNYISLSDMEQCIKILNRKK